MAEQLRPRVAPQGRIITRFAPSPTGTLHIGSARTALFNAITARAMGGLMLVRIEDTDRERSTKAFEENILEGLSWLGISYDAFYRQSERGDVYERYINKLIDEGHAYESAEEKDGRQGTVIRFRNPNTVVTFRDTIRGEVTFDTQELGDFVIARDRRNPLFHLAVVVDDHEMGVTHIIRGEDHISNTPRQILIQEAIGASRPVYAHLPLVLAPDKSKLSKRHGATSVDDYRMQGYLPDALVNFLALLGWSPDESVRQAHNDIFTFDELVAAFSFDRIQKGGAVFDLEKLKWINKQHIKRLSEMERDAYLERYLPEDVRTLPDYSTERLHRVAPTLLERISIGDDLRTLHEKGEVGYFFERPQYEAKDVLWSKEPDAPTARRHIDTVRTMLAGMKEEDFTEEKIKALLWEYATKEGRGAVLWPVRFALSGRNASPDPFVLSALFGKHETEERLAAASRLLASHG